MEKKTKPKSQKVKPEPKAEGPGSTESSVKPKLTDKQAAFIEHYLQLRNATEAAKRAGYSADTAYSIGWENLRKPEISEVIKRRTLEVAADTDEILASLARVHRANLKPFFVPMPDGELFADLTTEEAQANFDLLKKVKVKRRAGGPPEDRWTETEYELELHDPLRAKELLGRNQKLWTDTVDHTSSDGSMTPTGVQFVPYDRSDSANS